MELLQAIGGLTIFLSIISIGITIALIVAIISTSTNTKNTVNQIEFSNRILQTQVQNQQQIINTLIRMEQQNTKYYNVNYTQLNKIIEQNSRILSEQKEETTL